MIFSYNAILKSGADGETFYGGGEGGVCKVCQSTCIRENRGSLGRKAK
jgi:hypothetical protein